MYGLDYIYTMLLIIILIRILYIEKSTVHNKLVHKQTVIHVHTLYIIMLLYINYG